MTETDVMDLREAAEYLRIAPDTLYNYLNSGTVPGFKVGNRWRVRRSSLDKWMEQQSKLWTLRGQQK